MGINIIYKSSDNEDENLINWSTIPKLSLKNIPEDVIKIAGRFSIWDVF